MNIRVEKNRLKIDKINENKGFIFEKLNKIYKCLATLTKKRERRFKLLERNKRWDMTTNIMKLKALAGRSAHVCNPSILGGRGRCIT